MAQVVLNELMEATWNYVTNITKQNKENMVWYHFPQGPPSLSLLFLGIPGGWGIVVPALCPECMERRTAQTYVKVGCKFQSSQ